MNALVVRGGTVLTPQGWAQGDLVVEQGRFVSGPPVVHIRGEPVDGPYERSERHTGGAGAERVAGAPIVEGEAAAAARAETLAAAGSSLAPGPATGGRAIDATGLRVVPGLVDLQCNGGFGIDLTTEPERLWELAALLPRTGVTAWLPTIVTGPPEVRAGALDALRSGPPPSLATVPLATPLGLHLEGPFLDPLRRGAHRLHWLRPPPAGAGVEVAATPGVAAPPGAGTATPAADDQALAEEVAGWSAAAGVRLVTLAPELPGALPLVRALTERGVVVSAGHTSATAAEAEAAVDAGVRYVTHLFNAMAPVHHREPGVAGVALTDPRVVAGVIADGIHVDARMVRLAAGLLGPRLSLVTDAVAAMGSAPGGARLGDATVRSGDDGVRLADGTLAGSTLSLDRAVRSAMALAGVGLAEAVTAATSVPAGLLAEHDRGSIAAGAVGDLVVLDDTGEVVATVVGGRVAWSRADAGAAPAATSHVE